MFVLISMCAADWCPVCHIFRLIVNACLVSRGWPLVRVLGPSEQEIYGIGSNLSFFFYSNVAFYTDIFSNGEQINPRGRRTDFHSAWKNRFKWDKRKRAQFSASADLAANNSGNIWLAVIFSLFIRRGDTKRGVKKWLRSGEKKSMRVCRSRRDSPGVFNRPVWQWESWEMRARVETRKIIEVRVRSQLWWVLAVEGKTFVSAPALNQKLNQPTCRTRGLEGSGLYRQRNKICLLFLDLLAFLPCGDL